MRKLILVLTIIFIAVYANGQNTNIFKLRAKQITMKTNTTEYGPLATVDFLVAFDFNSSRITFFREKKETYDIIKNGETQEIEEGNYTCFTCKNADLKDYNICMIVTNTKDKVIFIVTSKNVTQMIICGYINE
jgi:hypothetical protein